MRVTMAAKAMAVGRHSITFGTHILEPLTQPKNTAVPPRGGAMQDGIDVPFRLGRKLHVHGVEATRLGLHEPWTPASLLHDEAIQAVVREWLRD